ncbi:hypothetical protein [Aestuariicoccus sp. MJ-SS9]|uniref:hypothetical protein n=1 Tax=Aestuariicoccus sp. MJ-SS9 TaxID=3079855 RepID=UPI0029159C23|nr:hypothetical protein [Aestuariicoccus sp. MJ-SS9]MDU8910059.1 hypothetical protein [Aestuariicoccus sp. MJ-SS9]
MRQIFISALAATALFSVTPALAEEREGLVAECLAALESGDLSRAEEIAGEIKGWKQLRPTRFLSNARKCLDGVTGERWFYAPSIGGFSSKQEQERQERQRQEAERQRQEVERQRQEAEEQKRLALLPRKCALKEEIFDLEESVEQLERTVAGLERDRTAQVLEETGNQCQNWFEEDKRAALTNDICSKILLEIGLPESGIPERLAQAESDLSSERRQLWSAERELVFIEKHNMTPEEYTEQKEPTEPLTARLEKFEEDRRRYALGDECIE